jgi:hypothetical protein
MKKRISKNNLSENEIKTLIKEYSDKFGLVEFSTDNNRNGQIKEKMPIKTSI